MLNILLEECAQIERSVEVRLVKCHSHATNLLAHGTYASPDATGNVHSLRFCNINVILYYHGNVRLNETTTRRIVV